MRKLDLGEALHQAIRRNPGEPYSMITHAEYFGIQYRGIQPMSILLPQDEWERWCSGLAGCDDDEVCANEFCGKSKSSGVHTDGPGDHDKWKKRSGDRNPSAEPSGTGLAARELETTK